VPQPEPITLQPSGAVGPGRIGVTTGSPMRSMLNPPIDFSCQKVLCITIRVVDPNFITTTRLFALSEMTAELVGMDSSTT
jgi:hypothetical protein